MCEYSTVNNILYIYVYIYIESESIRVVFFSTVLPFTKKSTTGHVYRIPESLTHHLEDVFQLAIPPRNPCIFNPKQSEGASNPSNDLT